MATSVTAPTPKPEPSVTARASQELAAAKTGFDPFKPVRYTATFIGGSLKDGLNHMSHYGRKGMWVGMGLGLIAAIALSSLVVPLLVGTVGGLAIGALGGGSFGVLTGGVKAVGRVHRGEKYAEDLIQRSKVQGAAPISRADYRAAYANQRQRDGFITQQVLERSNENARDFNTYWQDMVSGGQNHDHGRGF